MAVTEDDYQADITAMLGAGDDQFSWRVVDWWAMYDDVAPLRLRYLYTLRHALDWLITQNWSLVDAKTGAIEEKQHQRIDTLQMLRDNTLTEIATWVARTARQRGGASVPLTTTVPIPPPACSAVDANRPGLAGSPYVRLRRLL